MHLKLLGSAVGAHLRGEPAHAAPELERLGYMHRPGPRGCASGPARGLELIPAELEVGRDEGRKLVERVRLGRRQRLGNGAMYRGPAVRQLRAVRDLLSQRVAEGVQRPPVAGGPRDELAGDEAVERVRDYRGLDAGNPSEQFLRELPA